MTAARGTAIAVLILLAVVTAACDPGIVDFRCDVETRRVTLDVVPDTMEDGTVRYATTPETDFALSSLRDHGWDCTRSWSGGEYMVVDCEKPCIDW